MQFFAGHATPETRLLRAVGRARVRRKARLAARGLGVLVVRFLSRLRVGRS